VRHRHGEICEGDTVALLVDGSNVICHRAPPGAMQLAALGIIAGFVVVWSAPARRRRARTALLVAGAALSLPGIFMLAVRRADAPARVSVAAAAIAGLEGALADHARAHGCAVVRESTCEACEPVARLALAHAGPCESGATVTLREGAIGGRCVADGLHLTCERDVSHRAPEGRPGR